MLIQVIAPHFVAGIVVDGDTVKEAAPILAWAKGRRGDWLRDYFARKRWTANVVEDK